MSIVESQRPRRFRIIWLAIAVAGILALFLSREPVLIAAGHWLAAGERPRVTDFVMVLPGGAETRPFVAAALVRRGWAQRVLIPQTEELPAVDDGVMPPNHELIRRVLEVRGVANERIQVLPGRSNSTWTDAAALREFLTVNPQATVAVVTNDYHVRRSQWVFRKVLGHAADRLCFISAPTDSFSPNDWWRYEAGLQAYLGEFGKFLIYLVLYGDLLVWAAGTGIAVTVVYLVRERIRAARQKTAIISRRMTA
jgi:uncharacterized SAM-binding protein YcdF (DUF218 family)